MIVKRRDHEHALSLVAELVGDPRAGVYGPDSATWRVARESILFLGGGRAALLQTAHPFVAHAIADHSRTKTDLAGRFTRTFVNVFSILFGDWDEAQTSARRVFAIHARIHGRLAEPLGRYPQGTRYAANDPEALLWVHATLIHTSVQIHELILGPLPPPEREAFYLESRRFARLFGVPDALFPPDWAAFSHYCEQMFASDGLAVGAAARDIGHYLFQPPRAALAPAAGWYRTITAGLLPANLREAYGLPWGGFERRLFDTSIRAIRAIYPRIPRRLRYLPEYVDAQRRLAGLPGENLYGRVVKRAVVAGLRRKAA